MTPVEYESRCAEMLRMNAHNMDASEIERFAYGSGDPTLQLLSARNAEMVSAAIQGDADSAEDMVAYAEGFMR